MPCFCSGALVRIIWHVRGPGVGWLLVFTFVCCGGLLLLGVRLCRLFLAEADGVIILGWSFFRGGFCDWLASPF